MSDQEPQHHHHHPHHHLPPIPPESDPKLHHHYHQPTKHVSPPPSPHVPTRGRHVATAVVIIVILLLIVGLASLILWLVYRPHKPQFTVAAAAVYCLNATSPPFLLATFQFTLVARNPSRRVSILYDCLTAYVSYRNQVITVPVALPAMYQSRRATVAFSPVIGGHDHQGVPVSVDVANGLTTDVVYGVVPMTVVVVGKLRWKAGVLMTKRYGVCVKCDVWIGLKRDSSLGQVQLLGSSQCKVDI
ncbi:NDR1/HIN1-like protein 1 [Linum grandiflorum]